MSKRQSALIGLVFLAVFSRLLPHPWNWTAVGAASLFAGSRFERLGEALFIPLAALLISDLILGFHSTMVFVYGAFALIVLAAWSCREWIRGWKIGAAALVSAVLFFLVSNFGVWLVGGFYSADLRGLWTCYVAGLPFLASQAMGDLFYSAVLFGLWAQAETRLPALAPPVRAD
ncbi:MAG: hypothetical protein KF802_03955 [Bdellovibrionaceae bacterium]|nr:hypothetical protein [Pseudobdellovibrionaceae bacterium]MBX3035172.1 hypothetical protein [Pseudobdellovibrionaceae bacterium]